MPMPRQCALSVSPEEANLQEVALESVLESLKDGKLMVKFKQFFSENTFFVVLEDDDYDGSVLATEAEHMKTTDELLVQLRCKHISYLRTRTQFVRSMKAVVTVMLDKSGDEVWCNLSIVG